MKKIVLYYGDADAFSAIIVSQKYGCPLMKASDYEELGIKAEEVIQIGGKPEDTDRYVSTKNAAALL